MKMFSILALIILAMYAAQTSLLTYLDYNGISANLMLLVIVSTSFLRGQYFGVAMGFATGLLQDLTSGDFFGCTTFAYMTVGLIFGKFSERIVKDQFFFPVVTAPLAAAIYFFITTTFIHLIGYPISIIKSLHAVLVPMMFYQFIFALPVYKIAYDFDKFVNDYYA